MQEGTDYLFYEKAYYTGGAITGLTNSEVVIVCTHNCVFMVPVSETTLGFGTVNTTKHWFNDGSKTSIKDGIRRLLDSPHLNVPQLETELRALLSQNANVNVIEVKQLAKLSVWTKFMPQVRLQRSGRRQTEVLALRGKQNTNRFKSFYSSALR